MPTNLYGPNDNFNLETAHVLPALVRKFYLAALLRDGNFPALAEDLRRYPLGFGIDAGIEAGNRDSMVAALERIGITPDHVLLWGSGSPYREFLHVDDLASAALYLMQNCSYDSIGEIVNVGTGVDCTIAETARIVKETVGFGGDIRYDSSKPDGTPRKLLDVSRLNELGWHSRIPLREGLERTISWYRGDVATPVELHTTLG
jgi:GDP-L-fucose synthase